MEGKEEIIEFEYPRDITEDKKNDYLLNLVERVNGVRRIKNIYQFILFISVKKIYFIHLQVYYFHSLKLL